MRFEYFYAILNKNMIDRNMKGHDLREKAGISQSTYFKLQHDQPVSTQMLVRICCALDCELWDITELVDKTGGGPVQFPGKTKLFKEGEESNC